MTPQTKTGLVICLSFLLAFLVLLVRTGPVVPPGDHDSLPSQGHDLQARRPQPDRRAPPLEDPEETPRPDTPSSSPAPGTSPELTPSANQQFEVYVVQKGDTLSRIARKFYGRSTPACIDALVEANKDRIKGKHMIMAGQELVIPKRMPLT
jgi:nucleoid-associated protein YgaU